MRPAPRCPTNALSPLNPPHCQAPPPACPPGEEGRWGTPSTPEPKEVRGCRDVRTGSTRTKRGSVPCIQHTQEGILSFYICLVRTLSLFRGTNQFRTPVSLKTRGLGRSQPRLSCFILEESVSPVRTPPPTRGPQPEPLCSVWFCLRGSTSQNPPLADPSPDRGVRTLPLQGAPQVRIHPL